MPGTAVFGQTMSTLSLHRQELVSQQPFQHESVALIMEERRPDVVMRGAALTVLHFGAVNIKPQSRWTSMVPACYSLKDYPGLALSHGHCTGDHPLTNNFPFIASITGMTDESEILVPAWYKDKRD